MGVTAIEPGAGTFDVGLCMHYGKNSQLYNEDNSAIVLST